jgi:hypothetical protein
VHGDYEGDDPVDLRMSVNSGLFNLDVALHIHKHFAISQLVA